MHYIADDLYTDAWVKAGLARLERYLALWRLFTELYPADAPRSTRNEGRCVNRAGAARGARFRVRVGEDVFEIVGETVEKARPSPGGRRPRVDAGEHVGVDPARVDAVDTDPVKLTGSPGRSPQEMRRAAGKKAVDAAAR